jgi:hypothetical protein
VKPRKVGVEDVFMRLQFVFHDAEHTGLSTKRLGLRVRQFRSEAVEAVLVVVDFLPPTLPTAWPCRESR